MSTRFLQYEGLPSISDGSPRTQEAEKRNRPRFRLRTVSGGRHAQTQCDLIERGNEAGR